MVFCSYWKDVQGKLGDRLGARGRAEENGEDEVFYPGAGWQDGREQAGRTHQLAQFFWSG